MSIFKTCMFNCREILKKSRKHYQKQLKICFFLQSSESQLQTIPKPAPSQSASKNKIVVLESELNSLLLACDAGIASNEAIKRIATLKKDIQQEKNILKRKISVAERQKKSRYSTKKYRTLRKKYRFSRSSKTSRYSWSAKSRRKAIRFT